MIIADDIAPVFAGGPRDSVMNARNDRFSTCVPKYGVQENNHRDHLVQFLESRTPPHSEIQANKNWIDDHSTLAPSSGPRVALRLKQGDALFQCLMARSHLFTFISGEEYYGFMLKPKVILVASYVVTEEGACEDSDAGLDAQDKLNSVRGQCWGVRGVFSPESRSSLQGIWSQHEAALFQDI
jgi:hypothetical protein